jgi:hypothetical protein
MVQSNDNIPHPVKSFLPPGCPTQLVIAVLKGTLVMKNCELPGIYENHLKRKCSRHETRERCQPTPTGV